jgi:hypothetical protein
MSETSGAGSPPPPHIACTEAREIYNNCVKASLKSFLGGSDPQAVNCELAADVLRVCLARNMQRRAAEDAPPDAAE